MLCVETYLAPSTIHGIGVFAKVPIAKGDIVWRFEDGVDFWITPDELAKLPEIAQAKICHYCMLNGHGYLMTADDGRFVNHSKTPNIIDGGWWGPLPCSIAVRDIAAGEEITEDYSEFDHGFQERGL